jgi:Domain of unknown function (DUF4062)
VARRVVVDSNGSLTYCHIPARNAAMRSVFVSSASKGMDAFRQAEIGAIPPVVDGFAPIAMENFGLRADTPLALCRAKVTEAAVFLGIIGHEYGSCPPGSDACSRRGYSR